MSRASDGETVADMSVDDLLFTEGRGQRDGTMRLIGSASMLSGELVRKSEDQHALKHMVSSTRDYGVRFNRLDDVRLGAEHRLTGVVGFDSEEADDV